MGNSSENVINVLDLGDWESKPDLKMSILKIKID
jgi:hypothetical protein